MTALISVEWSVLASTALAAVSGVPGLFIRPESRAGERLAVALLAAAALLGVTGAARALLSSSAPKGNLYVDAIAAMFLVQIFAISLLGAIYGLGYWSAREHPEDGRKLRLFYGVVTAGMALLVSARNAIAFLWGWESMALAAFLLITAEDRKHEVRAAGYIYLIATRLGTLCLFAMFALLYRVHGTWALGAPVDARSSTGTAVFLLGLVGFGVKAGVMPLHVWLPGAHANAPSHVSALMSGVLIKMGIYGLVRFTALATAPPLWWGVVVLALGVTSGVLGVAFAVGQHDLKRLLAYHSVENIGIIFIGLGVALIGRAAGRAELVVLGLGGALLHTWNHGLFKALLFLAAGSVLHAAGTREIDRLGGLAKAMPRTALAFLIGAVAICGLPPLNGFISELLVYLGLFRLLIGDLGALSLAAGFAAAALALIGALAVACFVKALGATFLGEPRSEAARQAHEAPASMLAPMGTLAAICAFIGLGSPVVAPILDRAVRAWTPGLSTSMARAASLAPLVVVTVLCALLATGLALLGAWLVARTRSIGRARVGTWDCGYAAPAPRMQYTSSSFADQLVGLYAWALRPKVHRPAVAGLFPAPAAFSSHVPDVVLDRLLVPAAHTTGRGLGWFRWLQRGSVHAYLLYILATLVWLLLWQRGR
jgi:hydrogenase-4 component B